MKLFKLVVTILTVVIFTGALFFSCTENNGDDFGTLLIIFPGSDSQRALGLNTEYFESNLKYIVDCYSPGQAAKSEEFGPGKKRSIKLSPGFWNIKVSVYNIHDPDLILGDNNSTTVEIKSGESTSYAATVRILTNQNKITSFKIDHPEIITKSIIDNKIEIFVPTSIDWKINSDDEFKVNFSITHTGKLAQYKSRDSDGWRTIRATQFGENREVKAIAVNDEENVYDVVLVSNALKMTVNDATWAGFDILNKECMVGDDLWSGKIWDLKQGDKIRIKGKLQSGKSVVTKPPLDNWKFTDNNGEFDVICELTDKDVLSINQGRVSNEATGKIDPLAIRIGLETAGVVIIDQLTIIKNNTVNNNLTDSLQKLTRKKYSVNELRDLFIEDLGIIDAGGSVVYQNSYASLFEIVNWYDAIN